MAIENKRNYAFDFLKLISTLFIILHHSSLLSQVMVRGYILVELFFFISGYFISMKIEKGTSFMAFMRSRVQKLYPGYLCAYVLLLLALLAIGMVRYEAFYGPLLEVLLLQNVGIPHSGGINHPLWFLSVLLYGGALVYIVRKTLGARGFTIFSGMIVALTYGFLAFQAHKIEYWGYALQVLYVPFWRGVSDLMIGMWIYQWPRLPAHIGRIVQPVSFLSSFALLFIPGKLDFLAVALLAVLFYSSAVPNTFLHEIGKSRVFCHCYAYQYSAYLNHALAIYGNRFMVSLISRRVPVPATAQLLSLLMIVAIMAVVSRRITNDGVDRIKHAINRMK